jgi:hypothetical protein
VLTVLLTLLNTVSHDQSTAQGGQGEARQNAHFLATRNGINSFFITVTMLLRAASLRQLADVNQLCLRCALRQRYASVPSFRATRLPKVAGSLRSLSTATDQPEPVPEEPVAKVCEAKLFVSAFFQADRASLPCRTRRSPASPPKIFA